MGKPVFQVVVPAKFRELVMKASHEVAGHMGVQKTYHQLLRHFVWPRLKRDASAFIKTCHTCQFDREAKRRQFSHGDQVMFLLLLLVVGSPFQAKFAGPFTVKKTSF